MYRVKGENPEWSDYYRRVLAAGKFYSDDPNVIRVGGKSTRLEISIPEQMADDAILLDIATIFNCSFLDIDFAAAKAVPFYE